MNLFVLIQDLFLLDFDVLLALLNLLNELLLILQLDLLELLPFSFELVGNLLHVLY